MKAKDYFVKYEASILEEYRSLIAGGEPKAQAVYTLFLEMSNEASDLMEKRKCKRAEAVRGVLQEINQKWNAVNTIFEKRYKITPLVRNGFLNTWADLLKQKAKEDSAAGPFAAIINKNKEEKASVVSE